jgi:hypothetical protein
VVFGAAAIAIAGKRPLMGRSPPSSPMPS